MKKLLLIVAVAVSIQAYAQERVAYWEPVTLSGKVEMLPAKDLQLGKEVPTRFPAIVLDHSITAGTTADDPDTPLATTGIVQLAATSQAQYAEIKRQRGRRVAIECKDLFPSVTAHHFEPILCTVERVITP